MEKETRIILHNLSDLKDVYEEYRSLFWEIETGEEILNRYFEPRIDFDDIKCVAWVDSKNGQFKFYVPVGDFIDYIKKEVEQKKQQMKKMGEYLDQIKEIEN
jgi:hypothetical protein